MNNQLTVYYGNGEVRRGPIGVDLSQFGVMSVPLENPERANIRDLKKWFVRMFSMDPNIYSVIVRCLFCKSVEPLIWDLLTIERSKQWTRWVDWCRRSNAPLTILVQAYGRDECVGESSSSVVTLSCC